MREEGGKQRTGCGISLLLSIANFLVSDKRFCVFTSEKDVCNNVTLFGRNFTGERGQRGGAVREQGDGRRAARGEAVVPRRRAEAAGGRKTGGNFPGISQNPREIGLTTGLFSVYNINLQGFAYCDVFPTVFPKASGFPEEKAGRGGVCSGRSRRTGGSSI